METIGSRIKQSRNKLKLTQVGLAKTLGVTPGAVAQWETDRSVPEPDRIPQIADALGVLSGWLLEGGNIKKYAVGSGSSPVLDAIKKQLDAIQLQVNEASVVTKPSPAEEIIRAVVMRMPICKLDAIPHMGIAAADEQDGRVWDNGESEPGTLTVADAIEPRVITVRGASAEELARDGQQCVIDIAHVNAAPGDLCVILSRDKSLRLKRKAKDRGKLRIYNSINRDFPPFEINAREVVAEFPVVTVLLKSKSTSPVETVDEGFPV